MLMILFNFGGYILSISELIGGIMSISELIGGIMSISELIGGIMSILKLIGGIITNLSPNSVSTPYYSPPQKIQNFLGFGGGVVRCGLMYIKI